MRVPIKSLFIAGPLFLFITIVGIVVFVYIFQSDKLSDQLQKQIKQNYRENKENELKNHIHDAISEITKLGLYKPEATDEEKSKALDALRKLRHYHSEDGYYYVYEVVDSDTIYNRMHPIFTDWENTNKADLLDCENKFIIRELAEIAKRAPTTDEQDRRFHKYMFRKPSAQGRAYTNQNCGDQKTKLGHVVMLEHWPSLMLGSGIYWDDAEEFLEGTNKQISDAIRNAMLLIAGVAGLSAGIVGFFQMRIGRRIGEEAEKLRLIDDLHESINQNLSFVVRAIRNKLEGDGKNTEKVSINHEDLKKLELIGSWALDDLYRIEGKAVTTPHATLVSGLKTIIERFCTREEKPVEFYPSYFAELQTRHLSENKKNALLSVAQEALNNTRHAHASRVEVELQVDGSNIILNIIDDGCGISGTSGRRGIGLDHIKRIMKKVGGSTDIKSSPNCGTIITASVKQDKIDFFTDKNKHGPE